MIKKNTNLFKEQYIDIGVIKERQIKLLHYILLFLGGVLLLSAYVNTVIVPQFFTIGVLELVLSLISIFGYLASKKWHLRLLASWLATIVTGTITIFLIIVTKGTLNTYLFTFIYMLAAYVLLGTKQGSFAYVIYVAIIGYLLFNSYADHISSIYNVAIALIMGGAFIFYFEYTKEQALQSLLLVSRTDELTKLWNRKMFKEIVAKETEYSRRYNTPLALILIDIDHFKKVNDSFGHDVGDQVLLSVAKILECYCRTTDFVARWGGEEFVLILPNTSENESKEIAKKLIQEVENKEIDLVGSITISIGLTMFKNEDTDEELFKRADNALYHSKENGRNQYTLK